MISIAFRRQERKAAIDEPDALLAAFGPDRHFFRWKGFAQARVAPQHAQLLVDRVVGEAPPAREPIAQIAKILLRVAALFDEAAINVDKGAIDRMQHDRDRRIPDDPAQKLLAPAQIFLDVHLVGDVDHHADAADRAPVFEERAAAQRHPAQGAIVMAADAKLGRIGARAAAFAGGRRCAGGGQRASDRRPVFVQNLLGEGLVTQNLARIAAPDGGGAGVEDEPLGHEIDFVGSDLGGPERKAQPLLDAPAGAARLRQIADDGCDLGRARSIGLRPRVDRDLDEGAILSAQQRLKRRRSAAAQRGEGGPGRRRERLRDDRIEIPADDLLRRIAAQRLGRRAPAQDLARGRKPDLGGGDLRDGTGGGQIGSSPRQQARRAVVKSIALSAGYGGAPPVARKTELTHYSRFPQAGTSPEMESSAFLDIP